MTAANKTKNQHYISQVELRLNAANPTAKPSNQRIFAFEVTDRENYTIRLRKPGGEKIANTLSVRDLFSFDVIDESSRHNLETQFGTYEMNTQRYSQALLQKLRQGTHENVKKEVLELFAAKFLNFLRNPHCVAKVMNTVGPLVDFRPVDPALLRMYERIEEGNKPHELSMCSAYGLTSAQYRRWLRALFLLLSRMPGSEANMFEFLIKELFEKNYVLVRIHDYVDTCADEIVLLSDRGFSTPVHGNDSVVAFDFNITSNAFAYFAFCDPARAVPDAREDIAAHLRANTSVSYVPNDLSALVSHNRLAVYQCAAVVYGRSESPRLDPPQQGKREV